MSPGPPRLLETLARILIPPASREEVLGDLHERYQGPWQYLRDLLSSVPFLILSRIRRTTDMQFLLMQALLVYGSFLTAAWYKDRSVLTNQSGLLQLAIPAGLTFVYLLVRNAFAPRLRVFAIEILVLGLCGALRLASQSIIYGVFWGLTLVSTLRMLFETGAGRPGSAAVPALALNQRPQRVEMSRTAKLAQDAAVTVLCLAIAAALIVLMPRIVYLVIVLLTWAVGYRFLKPR